MHGNTKKSLIKLSILGRGPK